MAQRYTLSFLLATFAFSTFAEHLPGGTLTARCVGGNFHEVTLKLFRECSGAAMIPQRLHFENDCGVSFDQQDLAPISVEDVSPLCAEDLPNSTCNGGTLIGFELYTYRTTVFLSPCNAWRINWSICCRNESLNVQGTPGLWLEMSVNNFGGFCNASPEFVDNTVPLVCVGQPVSFDASATDADGHLLRYGFVDAQFNLGQPDAPDPMPVLYFPAFSGSQPYTGMEIDSLTGRITFTPTLAGIIFTVVEVNEYDTLGNWVGSVMHDVPFYVSNCDNSVPSIESGVFAEASGVAEITADRALLVCSEGAFCAMLEFTDDDPDQILSLSSNITTALPGATLEVTGTNPITAEVCWNSTGITAGTYQFSITATDDACPIQGFQQFSYTVSIGTGGSAGVNAEVSYCAIEQPFDLLPLLGGTPSANGEWTDPDGLAFGSTFDPGSNEPGDYTYTVPGIGECAGSAVLAVVLLPETDPVCIMLGVDAVEEHVIRVLPDASMNGRFRLVSSHSGAFALTVIASDGRVVRDQQVQLTSGTPFLLDLSNASAGAYVLRSIGKQDGTLHSERIVVR